MTSDEEFTVKFNPLPEDVYQRMKDTFSSTFVPNYQVVCGDPGGFIMYETYQKLAAELFKMKIRDDDVWVTSFPKSGTTWALELVWLMLNNFDVEEAEKRPQETRTTFIEMPGLIDKETKEKMMNFFAENQPDGLAAFADALPVHLIDELPSPRLIKSHLPFYCLPTKLLDTSKVIYIARNPKDVIVSFYYHHLLLPTINPKLEFSKFVDHFISDEMVYAPYWPHVLDAWNKRHHPNMLFLFYEDLKEDLQSQVQLVAEFLNKSLTSEEVEKLFNHLSFENMKKVGCVAKDKVNISLSEINSNTFLRKGEVGDWENHFTPEMNAKVEEWIASNCSGTDFKFRCKIGKANDIDSN